MASELVPINRASANRIAGRGMAVSGVFTLLPLKMIRDQGIETYSTIVPDRHLIGKQKQRQRVGQELVKPSVSNFLWKSRFFDSQARILLISKDPWQIKKITSTSFWSRYHRSPQTVMRWSVASHSYCGSVSWRRVEADGNDRLTVSRRRTRLAGQNAYAYG